MEIEGSPTFDFDNPAIAANASWIIRLADNTTFNQQVAKYLPLDWVELVNDQAEDLDLVLNDVNSFLVLGDTTRQVPSNKFASIRITNRSANAISANTIRVTCQRLPLDADKAARITARNRLL